MLGLYMITTRFYQSYYCEVCVIAFTLYLDVSEVVVQLVRVRPAFMTASKCLMHVINVGKYWFFVSCFLFTCDVTLKCPIKQCHCRDVLDLFSH